MVVETPAAHERASDLRDEIGACEALVVGSGPNGLAAAVALARAGCSVCVIEGQDSIGGGARSAELTVPGFLHDVCSAVHPLAAGSPFFRAIALEEEGLDWIYPPAALAHPFEDGTAVLVERSVEATAHGLGVDEQAYCELFQPLVRRWKLIDEELLGPLALPRYPMALARFGLIALRSARALVGRRFRGARAAALMAGLCAHAMLPLEKAPTAAFGLVLGMAAHALGWPIPKNGSRSISNALARRLEGLGGRIVTGRWVRSLDDLPRTKLVLCDLTPRQLLSLAGRRFPRAYRRRLARYRYGMAAYKVDWALAAPIPWAAPECARASTVHLGASYEEIALSERAAWSGGHADKPFVLVSQPSVFDPSRAPAGRHIAWAYCHVPNGSRVEMLNRIEAQVERFAPGFRQIILARSVLTPADLERHNPNLVGGDINGGVQDLGQLFLRPTIMRYRTPVKGLYLCSSSTPPGGGVHGMCGYFAARAALRSLGSRGE